MALFSLIAKLGLDKTGFDSGLSAAERGVMRFGSALKAQIAAAFSVAAITAYTRSLVQYASKVKDATERTGAGAEALQTLGHAAKLTGSDFETVVRSFKDLSKARQEALDQPNSKAAQVFRALGIDAKKLKDLKLEDLFREIGRGFERNDFGASELAMVTELLGRSGAELLPMFKTGVDELEASARKAGIALRGEVINELDAIGDQLDTLVAKLRGPFAEALLFVLKRANELVTSLEGGFRLLIKFSTGFKEGAKKGPELGLSDIPLSPAMLGHLIGKVTGKLVAGVEGGVGKAMGDLAVQQVAQPGLGGLFGQVLNMLLPQIGGGKRQKREFNFDDLLKGHEPKAQRTAIQSDALGRIGGTVGGGDATQSKLNEMVRELKQLNRTVEVRGVRIIGEL